MIEKVKPVHELRLGHRASLVGTSSSGHIVAATPEGTVSVVGPDRERVALLSLGLELGSIALHPSGASFAATHAGGATIRDLDGRVRRAVSGAFDDAWFDAEGQLWTVTRTPDFHGAYVEMHDRDRLHVRLSDPFGYSVWVPPDSALPAPVPLWVATGHDGQAVYWLELHDSEIVADLFDDFSACTPPCISPAGDEFLILAEHRELRRYTLPYCELAGVLDLTAPGFASDLADGVRYLAPDQALIRLAGGFVYRVELESMAIRAEVRITGHEPRPVRELPGSYDAIMASDLERMLLTGADQIVTVHAERPDSSRRHHHRLVWWPPTHSRT